MDEITIPDDGDDFLNREGFTVSAPAYHGGCTVPVDDLKAALFNTTRSAPVNLTFRRGRPDEFALIVTMGRPIFRDLNDHDDLADEEWPDWYIEGVVTTLGRNLGKRTRVYLSCSYPNIEELYIQFIPDGE